MTHQSEIARFAERLAEKIRDQKSPEYKYGVAAAIYSVLVDMNAEERAATLHEPGAAGEAEAAMLKFTPQGLAEHDRMTYEHGRAEEQRRWLNICREQGYSYLEAKFRQRSTTGG